MRPSPVQPGQNTVFELVSSFPCIENAPNWGYCLQVSCIVLDMYSTTLVCLCYHATFCEPWQQDKKNTEKKNSHKLLQTEP